MEYKIFYRPVFYKTNKKLSGYEMILGEAYSRPPEDDYDSLSIISPSSSQEYLRFSAMLSSSKDMDGVSFVDKDPLTILRYLRGEKETEVKRTADWEKELPNWKVNVRGERDE